MEFELNARCPICDRQRKFISPDDYWSSRANLRSPECEYSICIPRHRALADVLFSLIPRDQISKKSIHESSPAPMGLSLWLQRNCPGYVMSGFFPGRAFGQEVEGLRNEDLERQTFGDGTFDVVIHLDVLEHVFQPFAALQEIERTLKPGGVCLFTAPTYPDRHRSEQVAFQEANGLRIVGEPEYHGNPQNEEGALVTWRYGYDLPRLISQHTNFDIEVRRWHSRARAIMGPMTEVYILKKPGA
ncbi:class I SAM-dependent methyltransferase [Methylocystis parvus]|uniref:class I SAM-dependent methyltransferase n=1 Tax=Methylocystis parvus TaxID=134 RepID=UPI003C749699